MNKKLAENLKRINGNIQDACARSNRDPQDVTLVAVTKSVDVDIIRHLLELGQADLGESKVQDLAQRRARIQEYIQRRVELSNGIGDEEVTCPNWHMIGHLQRNKVKQILPFVKLIHSVDSLRLAEEINTNAAKLGLADKVEILLQVNTSQEKQKTGLAVGAVAALAEQIETLPNITIAGLMTMAPFTDDKDRCRFCFSRLYEIFVEMKGEGVLNPHFRHLSMGMSQDYEIAVEEGATLLRIGSALFE